MPLSTLQATSRDATCKTESQDGVAVSFLVGLFHSLQHAGLSRRSLIDAATTCAEDIVVLQRLRMVRPHTRVIILTKEWLPGDILKAIRNHAFSYFTMPIAIEDLREFIKYALEQPVWDDGIEMIQGNMGYVVLAVRCDLGTLEQLMQFMRESVALPE